MSDNNGRNGVISRDAFFAACKSRAVVVVDLPEEFGIGRVNVRKLTLGQIKEFDAAADNYERAKLLILHSIVDGNANRIFESLTEVDTLEMPLFKALSEAVADVNALTKISEEATKNS